MRARACVGEVPRRDSGTEEVGLPYFVSLTDEEHGRVIAGVLGFFDATSR